MDRRPEFLRPVAPGQTATEREPVWRPLRTGRTGVEIVETDRRLDE
jgi:hypothetical protein